MPDVLAITDLWDVCRFAAPGEVFTSPRVIIPAKTLSSVELACGNYEPGRFGYALRDTRVLPQLVPCKGCQAVPWEVPRELLPLLA